MGQVLWTNIFIQCFDMKGNKGKLSILQMLTSCATVSELQNFTEPCMLFLRHPLLLTLSTAVLIYMHSDWFRFRMVWQQDKVFWNHDIRTLVIVICKDFKQDCYSIYWMDWQFLFCPFLYRQANSKRNQNSVTYLNFVIHRLGLWV